MANTLENEVIKEICSSGDKTETIPAETSAGSNALSYADGFPIATATPQSDGGIPPKRTDMNKVLNLLSKNLVFLQNGGSIEFDSDVSTAIGGYPKGARLLYHNDNAKINIESLLDNNTIAPTNENVYYATNIKVAEGLVNSPSDIPPVSASASTLGQIYLVKAVVSVTPYAVNQAFICVESGDNYVWSLVNVTTLFNANDTVYVKSTKDYVAYYNTTVMTVVGYNDLNTYKWIYVSITPSQTTKATLVRAYRSGVNWCRVWSDGWCEQGGQADGGSNQRSLSGTLNFLEEFKNTSYTLVFSPLKDSTSGGVVGQIGARNKTTTSIFLQFYGNSGDDTARYFMWEAKGYIK